MTSTGKRIVVMGGSFNPPTSAHYKLMVAAVDALGAGIGFFVPVSDAYLKRKMRHSHPPVVLSEEMRTKMLEAMCASDSRLQICTKELGTIVAQTMETMHSLQEDYPDSELYFVFGADKLTLLSHLAEIRSFLDDFKVVLFSRGGDKVDELIGEDAILTSYMDRIVVLPQPEGTENVSSSKARELMLSGESGRELLCPSVWELFKDLKASDFPDVINRFTKEYAFLSNQYQCPFIWEGHSYRSAGAAFRAEESREDPLERMEAIQLAKFTQNSWLMEKLKQTGNSILINGNNKHETYWGVDRYSWKGENHLGKILMRIRDKEV